MNILPGLQPGVYSCPNCGAEFRVGPTPQSPPRTDNNGAAAGVVGGAILGGAIGGPPGAIIGGLVGLILGTKADQGGRR
jgi:uncharacterized membrane protein